MDVERMKALLEGAARLRRPAREQTLFDIGARGYFENPTSDLLAFFLDPDAEHGFADEVLAALLGVLPRGEQPALGNWHLCRSPRREWVTSDQKRIDLVLESDRWVLALENKIYHSLNNDFSHYSADLLMRLSHPGNKKIVRVVLSPTGAVSGDPGWIGIPYADFLSRFKLSIGDLFSNYGESKWLLFLREFIVHLENLTMTDTVTDAQQKYVLENLGDIHFLNQKKDQALESVRNFLLSTLEVSLDNYGLQIISWQDNWKGGPAMRFRPKDWKGQSVLTMHLPFEEPGNAYLICYIDKQNGDFLSLKGHDFALEDFDSTEVERTTRLFIKRYQRFEWDAISADLNRHMNSLIRLEMDWQF